MLSERLRLKYVLNVIIIIIIIVLTSVFLAYRGWTGPMNAFPPLGTILCLSLVSNPALSLGIEPEVVVEDMHSWLVRHVFTTVCPY